MNDLPLVREKKTVIFKGDFVYMYPNGMEFLQICENIAQLTL